MLKTLMLVLPMMLMMLKIMMQDTVTGVDASVADDVDFAEHIGDVEDVDVVSKATPLPARYVNQAMNVSQPQNVVSDPFPPCSESNSRRLFAPPNAREAPLELSPRMCPRRQNHCHTLRSSVAECVVSPRPCFRADSLGTKAFKLRQSACARATQKRHQDLHQSHEDSKRQ